MYGLVPRKFMKILTSLILVRAGYDCETCTSASAALEILERGGKDVVVSDVTMPRMDGIGLVSHIKQDDRLRSIPVIVVSYKDRKEELFNLRFQLATGHLEDASRIREVRKELARLQTVQRERELKIR